MATLTLSSFDEIEVGRTFGPFPWSLGDTALDAALDEYDQWLEWFVGEDAEHRRLIPPALMVGPCVAANPYRFRGIAAGVEQTNHRLLYRDRPYSITLSADEKYLKRGREYVWFRAEVAESAGPLAHTYRWLQVLSPLASDPTDQPRQVRDVRDAEPDDLNEYPYVPPVQEVRDPAAWQRADPATPCHAHYLPKDATPGYLLVAESARFSWRRARDYAELRRRRTGEAPATAAYSIHSHSGAAREIGLDAANISGANLVPFVSTMMLRALGDGWLRSGFLSVRFLKPLGLTDYLAVKGRLAERASVDGRTRLGFEVWGENQRGERILAGQAHAVHPEELCSDG